MKHIFEAVSEKKKNTQVHGFIRNFMNIFRRKQRTFLRTKHSSLKTKICEYYFSILAFLFLCQYCAASTKKDFKTGSTSRKEKELTPTP